MGAKKRLDERKKKALEAGEEVIKETKKIPYKPGSFDQILPYLLGGVGAVGGWWFMGWINGSECQSGCVAALSNGGSDKEWATSTCELLANSNVSHVFAQGDHHVQAAGLKGNLLAGTAEHGNTHEIVVGAKGTDADQHWVLKGTDARGYVAKTFGL